MYASRKRLHFPVRAAVLIGLGVAAGCPRPAGAQGVNLVLNTGDALSVSGSGTSGTYHNLPVMAPMSGYTNYTGNANASGNPPAVETDGAASFTLGAGGSLTGGQYSNGLNALGSGTITVSGGAITAPAQFTDGLTVYGSGPVMVSGGTITGGAGGSGLSVHGSGPVTVSGGVIAGTAGGSGLTAGGTGLVTITGGAFTAGDGKGLFAEGSSLVTVSGGTFTTGAGGYGLFAGNSSVIDLFGTGFSYTVGGHTTQITSGTLPSGGTTGTLSGTLLNGQALNATRFLNQATIEVNVTAAPEPSQSAALTLGALGLAGLTLRARRRRALA